MIKNLNLSSDSLTFYEKLENFFLVSKNKGYCCAVNLNIIVYCYDNKEYYNIIKNANFNICDGINVKRINNLINSEKIKLFTGPDLFETLVFNTKYKHFFLGADHIVLESLKNRILEKKVNTDKFSFYSPPFLSADKFDYPKIASKINKINPDIIWVGLGAPKQEHFMSLLLPFLNRGLTIGVGAAFNFFSGIESLKRAPIIFRRFGLEWLFRAFQEPRKILKRQLKNLFKIPYLIVNELINFKNYD
tara:strand:- start:340 stop:1080 length:741 start_codon:yes stop_codon:yes gene_type:complete